MADRTCEACAWFDPEAFARDYRIERQGRGRATLGFCRKKAPHTDVSIASDTDAASSHLRKGLPIALVVWPTVRAEDWCSKWEANDGKQERA